jgi:hypothetical protein
MCNEGGTPIEPWMTGAITPVGRAIKVIARKSRISTRKREILSSALTLELSSSRGGPIKKRTIAPRQ